jgi:hypothetical protein
MVVMVHLDCWAVGRLALRQMMTMGVAGAGYYDRMTSRQARPSRWRAAGVAVVVADVHHPPSLEHVADIGDRYGYDEAGPRENAERVTDVEWTD